LFLGIISAYGQHDSIVQEKADTNFILIPEIVITAQRIETDNINRPESISTLSNLDPRLGSATSTPDALSVVPGVWMQQTNLGGGSPFLRGLTGYHTLILIDGIRLNNSTFRSGPNQYLNTIDPLLIDHAEVMKGQGSVPYGSDALGGVVQLFSKSPDFSVSQNKLTGRLYGKYMSHGMEKSSRFEIETNLRNTAFIAGATLRDLGDIVAGEGLGTLSPTGYTEKAVDGKIKHRFNTRQLLTGSIQLQRQEDVPLYHQIENGNYSKYQFDPQQRFLSYLRLESFYESPIFSRISYTASYQNSLEKRIKQKTGSTIRDEEEDKVSTFNGSVEVFSRPANNWNISSGIEYYEDFISSVATATDEVSGESQVNRGLYPDGSRARNFALYTLHSLNLERFSFTFGGRFNHFQLLVPDETLDDVKLSPSALVGNAGLNYKIAKSLRFAASISSGFRAPNINDVSSLGVADFRYEIPNYELKPEKSVNVDVGLKLQSRRYTGNIILFRNQLNDLITNVKSTYNGNDSIEGVRVYQRKNVDKALIQGIEADGTYSFLPSLRLFGNISYTYGRDLNTDAPLRRIPPLNSRLGLEYISNKHFSAMIEWAYAGEQSRLSQGDIDDNRIQEGGTPSWNVVGCSLGYTDSFFQVNAGIHNIFNEAYRYHGSGIDGRGRSIWISLRITL
jgi:iron complex outermembrane receptor protein/hemoglobin/transferrin/lactoferrin receptor protein